MKLVRRRFLSLAAGMAALPALSRFATADDYPSRSVRIVVGYAAGGVSDILARLIGQRLSERLGQPFVIENRPGAVSNVAAEVVVRAPPDGYTLFLAGISNAINVTLYPDLSFNFRRDMAPIGLISRSPLVMEVNPSVPAQTVAEFISYARDNQSKITMASAGAGGATHVSGELFQLMTGIKMLHVPYRGSPPALTDLMAGREQVMFDNLASSIALIRAGKLRALGLTSKSRSDALPDVPSISEFVPGYEASIWNGITAPKNTPPEIVTKLNGELGAILAEPKIKAQYADLGNTPVSSTPDEFAKLIADDTEKWAKVVKFADIKPE
jgi:tripartite-type tricarboxylate transporter receptor subunit TctC